MKDYSLNLDLLADNTDFKKDMPDNSKRPVNGKLNHKVFFSILLSFCLGFFFGIYLNAAVLNSASLEYIPTLYSGIPDLSSGFFSWFSTYLINMLIGITIVLLLGMTYFGIIAIPLLIAFKGVIASIAIMSYFGSGTAEGIVRCAIIYTPVAALSLTVLIMYSAFSMGFSLDIVKSTFNSKPIDIKSFKSLFTYVPAILVVSVAISVFGALIVQLYLLFI